MCAYSIIEFTTDFNLSIELSILVCILAKRTHNSHKKINVSHDVMPYPATSRQDTDKEANPSEMLYS